MTPLKKAVFVIVLIVITASFFATLVTMSEQVLASKGLDTSYDYYWFWVGSRAVLTGQSPYSTQVTQVIQQGYFGHVLPANEYQHAFPYPPYIAYLFSPLAFIPFGKSALIWLTLQFPLLIASLVMISHVLKLRFTPLHYVILSLVCSIGFVYPMIVYTIGQLPIFLLFLFALSGYLLARGNVLAGGALLAVTSIRPDYFLLGGLIAVFVLYRSTKLKAFIVSVLVSLAVLTLSSMAFIGFWIPDWLSVLTNYSGGNPFTQWPPEYIQNSVIRWLLLLSVVLWGTWYVWKAYINPTIDGQLLVASAMILVVFVLDKQTGPYYMSLLLVPAFLLFRYMVDSRWRWLILILMFSPWFYRIAFNGSLVLVERLVMPLEFIVFQLLFTFIRRYEQPLASSVNHHTEDKSLSKPAEK